MSFFEAIRLALRQLWSQKMKSGFSLIGVFIGVTFLIAVVSIVEGMNRYMTDRFAGTIIGVNTFHVRRIANVNVGDTPQEVWRQWLRRPRISYHDAEAVAAGIKTPVVTAWESSSRSSVTADGRLARDIEITGATERYFDIKNLTIAQGRAFTAQEVRAGSPVVVLGHELAERLFEGRDPVGREVKIRDFPYRVIGVVEPRGNLFGISLDKFGVAPALSPVKRFVNPPGIVDALIVQAASLQEMREAMSEAEAIMRSRRHLRPGDENNFVLETADAVLDFWGRINAVLMAALPGLVGISLVVGGIVIMNIMLMAVAERTREIGLRKSLGARRGDILRQFLVESTTLAAIGAALGVGTGIAAAGLIQAATPLPTEVAPWSIAAGVALGAGVGIIAGVYPAARAARLDPIAALRQE